MQSSTVLTTLLVAGLLVATAPAGAVPTGASVADHAPSQQTTATNESANASVDVSTGAQLSTIVTSVETDVRTEYEETAFELRLEPESGERRVDEIADRHEELSDRASDIRSEYRDATESYQEGDISEETYAQRVAALNARAESVDQSLAQLENRTDAFSNETRTEAGINVSAIRSTRASIDGVTGTGPSALLERFTGAESGEVDIEASNGITIEAQSDEGGLSREIEREHEGNGTVSIDYAAATDTARAALTDRAGSWLLAESELDRDDGVYAFEFVLEGANETGEAEIGLDAADGSVIELEEEIEPREEVEERDDEHEADEREGDETETVDDENATVEENRTLQVDRTTAAQTARDRLPAVNGTWTLASVEVDRDDTVYEFEFTFENDTAKGDVDATVDGVSGDVIEFEEEIEHEVENDEAETEDETETGDEEESEDEDNETETEDDETETEEEETETEDEEETETETADDG